MQSRVFRIATAAAALTAFSGLAACNSPTEEKAEDRADAIEDQADAMRDSADAQADQMEDTADTMDPTLDGVDSATEQTMENKAEAVREMGEAKADAMEDKADAVHDAADQKNAVSLKKKPVAPLLTGLFFHAACRSASPGHFAQSAAARAATFFTASSLTGP